MRPLDIYLGSVSGRYGHSERAVFDAASDRRRGNVESTSRR